MTPHNKIWNNFTALTGLPTSGIAGENHLPIIK